MRQETSSCGTQSLTKYFRLGQDISEIFHPSDIKLQQKCVIFGYTSLAAPGALAHGLQRLPVGPKMADGVWKGVFP